MEAVEICYSLSGTQYVAYGYNSNWLIIDYSLDSILSVMSFSVILLPGSIDDNVLQQLGFWETHSATQGSSLKLSLKNVTKISCRAIYNQNSKNRIYETVTYLGSSWIKDIRVSPIRL